MSTVHKSVLLNEVIEGLNLSKSSIVVDGTFGGGGHAREILARFPEVKIIAIDQDQSAWDRAKEKFQGVDSKISFHNVNFKEVDKVLASVGIDKIDALLLDIGLSSDQLENSGRGFSFMKNEPLMMTMKANPSPDDLTASEIVNTWSEESLEAIIYGYGEEKFAKRIAKAITERRRAKRIDTTLEMVSIIQDSVPVAYRRGRVNCATKTFQALRIAVNDELGALKQGIERGFEALRPGGRMAVISFHSLEDRIIKRFYRDMQKEDRAILINKKPILSTGEELKTNNRSRSAKLRILEKI